MKKNVAEFNPKTTREILNNDFFTLPASEENVSGGAAERKLSTYHIISKSKNRHRINELEFHRVPC
jgi:hypothetical protein